MEFIICDLLDDFEEVDMDFEMNTGASARRIKELTMKKIHKEETKNCRGMSVLMKVAVAAAILASLTIPVMAAAGFHFTDWLEGIGNESKEAYEVRYSTWEETEGFWQISLTAKDLTTEGMTLVCREVQDSPVTGSLKINGGYCLERWNGETFEAMTAAAEIPPEESREIMDGDSFELEINWVDTYGQLEPGRYRLYKTFTYTYSDGSTIELRDWAEFRIFNEEMTPYIEQCGNALDELLLKKDSHIQFTRRWYGADPEKESGYIASQIWRSGEDYLICNTTEDNTTGTGGTFAELLLEGKGYSCWDVADIFSGETNWESDALLTSEENQFDLWYYYLSMDETQVGEIWVEEQEIVVLTSYTAESGDVVWKEFSYCFDDAGNLVSAEVSYLPEPMCAEDEKRLSCTMVVQDTAAEEIAKVIAIQNVEN